MKLNKGSSVVRKHKSLRKSWVQVPSYPLLHIYGYVPQLVRGSELAANMGSTPHTVHYLEYNSNTSAGHPLQDDDIVRYSLEMRRVNDKEQLVDAFLVLIGQNLGDTKDEVSETVQYLLELSLIHV